MKLSSQHFDTLTTIASQNPGVSSGLEYMYDGILSRKQQFLDVATTHPTPFFLFDVAQAHTATRQFCDTFTAQIPTTQVFYATKANDYVPLVRAVVEEGCGADASSVREFKIALEAQAKHILCTGPAKSDELLKLVVAHAEKVTLMIDSFTELKKIGIKTAHLARPLRVGVRVYTSLHRKWGVPGVPTKFGIALEQLVEFWDQAQQYAGIELVGIQCHMSWNTSAEPYVQAIAQIGEYLTRHFSPAQLNAISCIDLGGGFYPSQVEGEYPWTTASGKLLQLLEPQTAIDGYDLPFVVHSSVSLQEYATAIAQAIVTHLQCLPSHTQFFFEPGRMLAYQTMHIMLRLVDAKGPTYGIADGGINMIGWEKYENTYAPLINLTHPARELLKYTVFGSLCTPHDVWSYYCHAQRMAEDDVLIIPYQGAYTYTLRQSFIQGLPSVVDMA